MAANKASGSLVTKSEQNCERHLSHLQRMRGLPKGDIHGNFDWSET